MKLDSSLSPKREWQADRSSQTVHKEKRELTPGFDLKRNQTYT